jgi:hypothetical protein
MGGSTGCLDSPRLTGIQQVGNFPKVASQRRPLDFARQKDCREL